MPSLVRIRMRLAPNSAQTCKHGFYLSGKVRRSQSIRAPYTGQGLRTGIRSIPGDFQADRRFYEFGPDCVKTGKLMVKMQTAGLKLPL